MITRLRAQSLKSWKDTGNLALAPLTGFFGANSSGKTSLLQILLMLKQTAESPDRSRVLHTGDSRSLVDLGTYFDLVFGHQPSSELRVSLSWELPKTLAIYDSETVAAPRYQITALSFTTGVTEAGKKPVVESFEYDFDGGSFGMRRKGDGAKADQDKYDLVCQSYQPVRIQGRPWPLPPPVKCYGFPDEAVGYYQNTGFLPAFTLAFEELFSRVAYLGPLREYPQRSYVWAGERPGDVGRRGELAVPALLASQASGKAISRGRGVRRLSVEEAVARWLQEMGLVHTLTVRPIAENRKDYEVRVKKAASSSEVLITDVGFGVSQILPVLVLCYYVPQGSTLILEQPEIHLHPAVQAGLADVMIDVVRTRGVQIIVESHSEHLLRRLQRRVADDTISPDQTALYFCRMDNGESRIDRLNLDLLGNILNWPKDFFGDEMGELVAMTQAGLRRRVPAR